MERDAAARQIRVSLQMAQRLAVTDQANLVVGFDVPNARLRVPEDVNGDMQQDAGECVRWVPLEGQTGFAAPAAPIPGGAPGQALVNVGPGTVDRYPSVVFCRDGSARASAVIYVRSARRNVSTFGAIAVTQATGRIDRVRTVIVTAAGRYQRPRPDAPLGRRTVRSSTPLINMTMPNRPSCGLAPDPVVVNATLVLAPGVGQPDHIHRSWTRATDDGSGERDVERYPICRSVNGAPYGEPLGTARCR